MSTEARAFGWPLQTVIELRRLVTATDEEMAEAYRQLMEGFAAPMIWATDAISIRILANRLERRFAGEVREDGSVWVQPLSRERREVTLTMDAKRGLQIDGAAVDELAMDVPKEYLPDVDLPRALERVRARFLGDLGSKSLGIAIEEKLDQLWEERDALTRQLAQRNRAVRAAEERLGDAHDSLRQVAAMRREKEDAERTFAEHVKMLDCLRIRFGGEGGKTIVHAIENTLQRLQNENGELRSKLAGIRAALPPEG